MSKFDNIDLEKVNAIKLHIEDNSKQMDNIVNDIISVYVKDLDEYVSHIDDRLCQKDNPPTDQELETFCLNLSSLIYFAGGMCEQLGLRSSIATAVYNRAWHKSQTSHHTLLRGKRQLALTQAVLQVVDG